MSIQAPESKRLLFIDTLRGLAVLFMVQLHTSHGWLRPELRAGVLWSVTQFFGGLAAPVFLALAGTSLGVQWGR
ncbi:MAG: heparan-alpha-glucosaminide N-acetyltransferase domain-containing protein, partial [Polyangiales bacterium]